MWNRLPYHFFAYGSLFGATVYQSFYSGIIAHKALPIDMFSKLQQQVFPGYFCMQTILSVVLLATTPFHLRGKALYSLGATLGTAAINWLVVLPLTTPVSAAREAQMQKEGKTYRDPTASDEMKALNKTFRRLHGISMLVALGNLIGLTYYGVFFANRLSIASL